MVSQAADLGDADILIGMDIITRGEFAVTTFKGFSQFSFRYPAQGHIDFIDDTRKKSVAQQFKDIGRKTKRKNRPKPAKNKRK